MLSLMIQWSVGFSLLSIVLLWLVYWMVYRGLEKTWLSKGACTTMLLSVAVVQFIHGVAVDESESVFENRIYVTMLYLSAPAFFFFAREILQLNTSKHPLLLLHMIPAFIGPWLQGDIAVPMAFLIGCGYALWLCRAALRLKEQRQYFRLEMATFIGFAVAAFLILLVGLLAPWLGEDIYIASYANLTALILFSMLLLVLRFPDIGQKTVDAVAASYAVSTLKNADCALLAQKLQNLLGEEKIYRDENLSLAMLAEQLELSPHQTSELINTQFNMGFSRLVREYRIEEAKQQLRNEPKASVLSIGLAVGFSSQSNFYAAFREITGETPGQFRKKVESRLSFE